MIKEKAVEVIKQLLKDEEEQGDIFFTDEDKDALKLAIKTLSAPAVPQGEWINHRNDYGHNIADCSLCGKAMQWHDEDEDGIPRYCWYCGAKMKGGADMKGGAE